MKDFLEACGNNVVRCCDTCESFIGGTCTGGDGIKHSNGDVIEDPNDVCDDWYPSLRYYEELDEKNEEFVMNLDQSILQKKCGNCKLRMGTKCYVMAPHVVLKISSKNSGCENWKANDEYIKRLRVQEQEG